MFKWFRNESVNKVWIPRIEKAVDHFWGAIEELSYTTPDGSLVTAKLETEGDFHNTKSALKILLDGKPVCEITRRSGVGHTWYEFERFNYGKWAKVFWDSYQGKLEALEREEAIKQKALFEPLDE